MHLLLRLTSFAPVWQSQTVPVPDDLLAKVFHRFTETVKDFYLFDLTRFLHANRVHLVRKRYHAVCPAIAFGLPVAGSITGDPGAQPPPKVLWNALQLNST